MARSRTSPRFAATLMVNIGVFNSDADTPRFSDLPRDATPTIRGGCGYGRSPGCTCSAARAVDVGPGGGSAAVSATDSTVQKLVLTPISATFIPFALKWPKSDTLASYASSSITTFVPQGFKGADFGNRETKFNSGLELGQPDR